MGSRVVAVCDICGAQQELKTGVPVPDWDRELELEGWWRNDSFDAVCPNHPRRLPA